MDKKAIVALVALVLATLVIGCTSQEEQATSEESGQTNINELSAGEARDKVIEYVNNNLVMPGTNATAVSVEDKGSVYEVTTLYQGMEIPVYISKDGNYLFFNALNMSQELPRETPTMEIVTPTATHTPEKYSIEELQKFADCLNESGFKIYGAKWCPHCQDLVNMLGGYDVVSAIYVECPEYEELCTSEGVTAYPTIKINGEEYMGPRSFEAFSDATGCPVPAENS
jgi:glutaredoxin